MTLLRRLLGQLALLWACLLIVAVAAAWGVRGLRQDFSVALSNYERLRDVYVVGFYVQSAKAALRPDFPDVPQARLSIRRAAQRFGESLSDDASTAATANALAAAVTAMDAPQPSITALDRPLAELNTIVETLRAQIDAAQLAADRRQRTTLVTVVAVAVVAGGVSAWVGRRQVRAVVGPLSKLSTAVRRVAAGRLEEPLTLADADREFARLADDFNAMASDLRTGREALQARVDAATRAAVQSERLAGVGLLAAGVAHEINNPLSIIAARVELLLAKRHEPAAAAGLSEVLEETFRCKRIIERLLQLSRAPSGHRTAVDLAALTAGVVEAVRPMPAAASIQWRVDAHPVSVQADEGELRQVVLNLLLNAVQFSTGPGRVDVSVTRQANTATLVVEDGGVGIDSDAMARLFEPFYSTRVGDIRGTGLGLAISRAVIEGHGGRIEAHSDGPGRGSRFTVRLPAGEEA